MARTKQTARKCTTARVPNMQKQTNQTITKEKVKLSVDDKSQNQASVDPQLKESSPAKEVIKKVAKEEKEENKKA